MLEIFKNWINVLLCLGIFTVIIKLIIPKNKLRKYIYSLLGIITIIAIISPVINVFKNNEMDESIKEVLSNMDTSTDSEVDKESLKNVQKDAVKNSFVESIKIDIKSKLQEKGVTVNKVEIFMDDNYNIQKIEVNIAKLDGKNSTLDSVNTVVKYVNSEYGIEYSKIEVIEEGKI